MAVAVSIVLGFLSGLGLGGGSLLMLYLTAAAAMDPHTARGVNLLFYLPSAALATWARRRQGTIHFRQLLPAIAAGCAAGILCTWIGSSLSGTFLQKIFGIVLLAAGVRELRYKEP